MNRLVRPVQFAFEPDVVSVFANLSFGAAGAVTLNQSATDSSKGLCAAAPVSTVITATTDGSTAVLTAVSSFVGLYVGMGISGAGIPAASTISSMNAGSGTITISANTTAAHAAEAVTVTGGQYVLTFGRNATLKQLDAYNKLLAMHHCWDESGNQGSASVAALAPAALSMFVVGNSISNSQVATITVQFGSGAGTSFVAAVPDSGSKVRLMFSLCRSSAI